MSVTKLKLHTKTKICSTCKKRKRKTSFNSDVSKLDKVYSACKLCRSIYTRSEKARLVRYKTNRAGSRYSHAYLAAKRKGRVWKISKKEYHNLIRKPCYYCGVIKSSVGIGLDRLSNQKDYLLKNVVPCCSICNKVKNIFFTSTEMLQIGKIIKNIRKVRNIEDFNSHKNYKPIYKSRKKAV